MLKLSNKTNPENPAVLASLSSRLSYLYTSRNCVCAKMSGHPSALHVIGRMQRMINLDSPAELLTSLRRLRDICKATADVIDAVEGIKTERYQLNRLEIATHVSNVTQYWQSAALSTEEIDLITQLITSFESNQNAWMLLGGTQSDDMHLKFRTLYSSILLDLEDGDIPYYSAQSDNVDKLGAMDQYIIADGATTEDRARVSSRLKNTSTLHRFALTRIVDHVYQLLMEKDIWYKFITSRSTGDLRDNVERAKGLRVFQLYLQNLLSYAQFFMIEMFMEGYNLVQQWITYFPPLDEPTLQKLNTIVRNHDMLHAKDDVRSLIDSFASNRKALATNALVIPREFLDDYGIVTAIDKAQEKASEFTIASSMDAVRDLEDKRYIPVLTGTAVKEFNIVHSIVRIVMNDKLVAREIDVAVAGLVPALVKGLTEETMRAFNDLQLKCTIPFQVPVALTWRIEKGVTKGVFNNQLHIDAGAPHHSWDYAEYIRNKFKFKIASDSQIAKHYDRINEKYVYDRDEASRLRQLFNLSWRSLVPSFMADGHTIYDHALLKSSSNSLRHLIEDLVGRNYELAMMELSVPHLRTLWATYFSSFALIYANAKALNMNTISSEGGKGSNQPILVEGYGKPYGVSYASLAGIQGTIESVEDDLVELTPGIYLRILKKIPTITDNLNFDVNFYMEHHRKYFSGLADKTTDVTKWVIDDSLLHLTCFPINEVAAIPAVMFTNKFAYITENVFINLEMYFKPQLADTASEIFPIPVVDRAWPYDRLQYFLQYKTFGSYSTVGSNAIASGDTANSNETTKAIEKIERELLKENQEALKIEGDTATNVEKSVKKVEEEVTRTRSEKKGPAKGAETEHQALK